MAYEYAFKVTPCLPVFLGSLESKSVQSLRHTDCGGVALLIVELLILNISETQIPELKFRLY